MKTSNCVMKILCTCIVIVATHSAVAAAAAAGGDPKANNEAAFRVPTGERQLFLDDYGIASIENLTRTMHQPAKKGAVIRTDPVKGGNFQIRSAPFWDPKEKVFRFMVADTGGPKSIFQWFTSADGLHWTPGDKMKMGRLMLVYDEHDPDASRRFKTVEGHGKGISV